MKKTLLYLFYSLLFFLPASVMAQTATHVVISEIYGAGGNTGAVYNSDFVELYNPTSADVDMSGWSVQYNSAVSTTAFTGLTVFPTGTIIKSHGYFLIQEQSGGSVGIPLPTPDIATTSTVNNFNMSGTAGKVALVNNSTLIPAQPTLPSATIIDLVGFGTTAAYSEGGVSPAPAPSTTTSIERKASANSTAATMAAGGTEDLKGNGWDSDNNANDFFVPTTINPQNSSSPVEPAALPVLTATPATLSFGTTQAVNSTSTAQSFSVSETNVPATGATLTVTAPFIISTTATGTYGATITFTQAQLASAQTVYVKFTPTSTTANSTTLSIVSTGATTATVTLTGTGAANANPATLTVTPAALTFIGQTINTTSAAQFFNFTATNLSDVVTATATAPYMVSKDGIAFSSAVSYTTTEAALAPKVYVQFTPTALGASTGTVTVATATATSKTVTLAGTGSAVAAAPIGTANHVVISELYGGNGNTYASDFIELYNPTATDVDMSNWSVQYNSATGVGAFSGITVFPAGSIIKSHGYYLVQEFTIASGTAVGAAIPTPDLATTGSINNFNMSGTAGKIALVNNATIIATKPTLPASNIVDLVSYGTTAVYYEGAGPAPAPSPTTSIERKASSISTPTTMAAGGTEDMMGNGYDTDNNSTDFFVPTTINPQNSASPLEPAPAPAYTVTPTTLTFSQNINTTSAAQSFVITGVGTLPVTSVGTTAPYLLSKTATGTYSTALSFSAAEIATKPTVYVEFAPTALGSYPATISVTGVGATPAAVTLTGTGSAVPVPTLTSTPTTLTNFSSTVGIASTAVQNYTISGTNLTTATTVATTGAYLVSKSSTTGFANSISFTTTEMAATPTVYVQFTPTVVGNNAGTAVATTMGGATVTSTVTLTGTGIAPPNTPPTVAAVADQVICYTTAQQSVALTGITAGTETDQIVVLSATSSNSTLFSALGILPVASGATTSTLNYTVANGQSGTAVITITAKDNGLTANGGNDTFTRTFNITVNALAVVNITIDAPTNVVAKGSTATLTATGGVSYVWSTTQTTAAATGSITSGLTGSSITIRPTAFTTYKVVATNASGCTTTQTFGVEVSLSMHLETSNVLTPNGDGKNDYWVIRNIDTYPGNNVKVFDKTGKLVFSKTGYNNDWNGYYNGSPLPQGTYIYVVDLGTGLPYRGTISVVRD